MGYWPQYACCQDEADADFRKRVEEQIESDFLDSAFRLKSSAAMTSQSILLTGFQPSGILAMPAVKTKQSDPARGNDGMPTFERELKSLHKAGGEQGGNISRQGQSRQARNQRRAEVWRQKGRTIKGYLPYQSGRELNSDVLQGLLLNQSQGILNVLLRNLKGGNRIIEMCQDRKGDARC